MKIFNFLKVHVRKLQYFMVSIKQLIEVMSMCLLNLSYKQFKTNDVMHCQFTLFLVLGLMISFPVIFC